MYFIIYEVRKIDISYDPTIVELFNEIKKIEYLNKEKLKKYGFNDIRVSILTIMMAQKDITQCEIVNKINVPKQTINYTIKDLYNDGLITISQDKNDKRSKILNLSEDGEIFLSEILDPITKINKKVKEEMGDEKVKSLIADLKHLSHLLEKNLKLEEGD